MSIRAQLVPLVVTWPDIAYAARYWPIREAPRNVIDFELFEMDDLAPFDPARSIPFMKGTLKWSGCAMLFFPRVADGSLRFCGLRGAQRFGVLLERIIADLGPRIPAWGELNVEVTVSPIPRDTVVDSRAITDENRDWAEETMRVQRRTKGERC